MMTEEEKQRFILAGRGALTQLTLAATQLEAWGESFEARGGGAVFGDDATLIAYAANDVKSLLTPERRATLARLRTDI